MRSIFNFKWHLKATTEFVIPVYQRATKYWPTQNCMLIFQNYEKSSAEFVDFVSHHIVDFVRGLPKQVLAEGRVNLSVQLTLAVTRILIESTHVRVLQNIEDKGSQHANNTASRCQGRSSHSYTTAYTCKLILCLRDAAFLSGLRPPGKAAEQKPNRLMEGGKEVFPYDLRCGKHI